MATPMGYSQFQNNNLDTFSIFSTQPESQFNQSQNLPDPYPLTEVPNQFEYSENFQTSCYPEPLANDENCSEFQRNQNIKEPPPIFYTQSNPYTPGGYSEFQDEGIHDQLNQNLWIPEEHPQFQNGEFYDETHSQNESVPTGATIFTDSPGKNEHGEQYLTLLTSFEHEIYKDSIIFSLLIESESTEQIQNVGLLLSQPPVCPPHHTGPGCFVFFVDGSKCPEDLLLSMNDLLPWSQNQAIVFPQITHHPIRSHGNGLYQFLPKSWTCSDWQLTEVSVMYPKEPRIRKTTYYMRHKNVVTGSILIIYHYLKEEEDVPLLANQDFSFLVPKDERKKVPKLEKVQPETKTTLTDNNKKIHILPSGHICLKVNDTRMIRNVQTVLTMITNSKKVEPYLNNTPPIHIPPEVCYGAFALFIKSKGIDLKTILNDNFSIWYKKNLPAKINYYGVEYDRQHSMYIHVNKEYQLCEFNLISIHLNHPRKKGMKKKIFYLIRTKPEEFIGHGLIYYRFGVNSRNPDSFKKLE